MCKRREGWCVIWVGMLLLFLSTASFSGEVVAYRIPYERLRNAADLYLKACCTSDEMKQMERRWKRRVDQKMLDNSNLREETAMSMIVLDWVADNKERFRKKDKPTIVQACFYFVQFVDKKYDLPFQFRDELNEKACEEVINYIETEANKEFTVKR